MGPGVKTAMDKVVQELVDWARKKPPVRVVILTSSRAAPHAQLDAFSDYDVILVVTDIQPFFRGREWLSEFGPVLVAYRDPLRSVLGSEAFTYVTQYETGLKIDFSLWPTDLLRQVANSPTLPDEIDLGYTVLLDKDGMAAELKPPTHRAHIPKPPSESEFLALV